jgi:hypothetical protein
LLSAALTGAYPLPFGLVGALRTTKNSGLQPALDHIVGHMDDDVPEPDEDGDEEMSVIRSGKVASLFLSAKVAPFLER